MHITFLDYYNYRKIQNWWLGHVTLRQQEAWGCMIFMRGHPGVSPNLRLRPKQPTSTIYLSLQSSQWLEKFKILLGKCLGSHFSRKKISCKTKNQKFQLVNVDRRWVSANPRGVFIRIIMHLNSMIGYNHPTRSYAIRGRFVDMFNLLNPVKINFAKMCTSDQIWDILFSDVPSTYYPTSYPAAHVPPAYDGSL